LEMNAPRVVLSSVGSDSGKTLVSAAVIAILRGKGHKVQPFKIGPDYIDTMYHTAAAGRASRNIDSWIMGEEGVREAFANGMRGADMAIIEGVRGLYEGASPIEDAGSTVHVAKILKAPVVIVLNSPSRTRTAAACSLGMRAMDREARIAGVILNKVSDERHEAKLRQAISYYTGLPVLGVLFRDPSLRIEKRHLGLMTAHENSEAAAVISKAAAALEKTLEAERLMEIMADSPPIAAPDPEECRDARVRVGVFTDRAFSFHYPDNYECLERAGFEIKRIDSIAEGTLGDVSGLLIGGGYPEVFANELEANSALRQEVRKRASEGMPIVGECGGLMYLCRCIRTNGSCNRMAGVFDSEVVMHDRPQGLSYTLLGCIKGNAIADAGDRLRGHEFHYSSVDNLRETEFAFEVLRGKGISMGRDGITAWNTLAMYTHMHYLTAPKVVDKLRRSCERYRRR